MILIILQTLGSISSLLVVIPSTVFILGVTLLGIAIEKSKKEEKLARDNEESTIAKEIISLEKDIKQAKKDGDPSAMISRLENLRNNQKEVTKKISVIKEKYASIDLINSVVKPSLALLIPIICTQIATSFANKLSYLIWLLFVCSALSLIYGLSKIYKSLLLIQDISSNRSENDMYNQYEKIILSALSTHDQNKLKKKVILKFEDKIFPLNVNVNTELDIKFRISLDEGKVLNNVEIWFFIPDGITLLHPPEENCWRQKSDYSLPNIRTVKVQIPRLSIGPYTPRHIKIRTPSEAGKYTLRYKIYGEGYAGEQTDFVILVE